MRAAPVLLALAALAAATPAAADFSSCVAGLRAQAASQGISGETFDAAFKGVTAEPKVIELMNNQPEFKTPIWDYLGTLVDEEKVAAARLTVTTDDNGDLRAMQKGLSGALTLEQVRTAIDTSRRLGAEIRKLIG